ncbi:hypothetical protein BAY60_09320 [Prauserella muralis]|uniref:Uncharacterized protein n=1 Tax=Prauserella muralis TaxID=588067 RepID=A0A2V4BC08_9PSEU|nr:hypothetical protein BAY60_09320 [Prauserella muralis]
MGLGAVNGSGRPAPRRVVRWWRGLTGSLAAGLAAATLVVLGAAVFGLASGVEGPGASSMWGHVAGTAVALPTQWVADRHRGPIAAAAGAVVVLAVTAVLWLFWWA